MLMVKGKAFVPIDREFFPVFVERVFLQFFPEACGYSGHSSYSMVDFGRRNLPYFVGGVEVRMISSEMMLRLKEHWHESKALIEKKRLVIHEFYFLPI